MTALSLFGTFVALLGIAMAFAPVMQIVRIVRRRSSADVSIWMLLAYGLRSGSFCAWGLLSGDRPLWASSLVGSLVSLATAVVVLAYRRSQAVAGRLAVATEEGS
jgi:uncharacterized protein with PQ loop repeat